ncbi:aspartate kinase [Haliangium sp.]|uniref:aspartate kinase n=1 Tax=Haliangium sp. TaxID=2663208 RepID=UPI003D101642
MPDKLIVQKYGGTSVADIDRIRSVARRCLETQLAGNDVAVVVSAMAGETNRLLALTHELHGEVNDREVDVVVATGEQVSVGLLALAIRALGGQAQSFLGHQVKIVTDDSHARARIRSIDPEPLRACFREGKIAVIAGFQGVDEAGNITTLGRGGSDTTGVAIAAALHADVCEIYTDVDGVFTADPRVVPEARQIERISYEAMLELASVGAKVLQIRSVEMGMKYGVPIHVRSSFHHQSGTWVVPEEQAMEHVLVSGIAAVRDESKITVRAVPDIPGVAAKLLSPLADAGIVIDIIVQNVSRDGSTDMSFTLPRQDRERAIAILRDQAGELCPDDRLAWSDGVAKISVVGVGMRSHAGVARRMFQLLSDEGINILMISTSEIKISCVILEKYAELALRVLHEGFDLHLPPEDRASP